MVWYSFTYQLAIYKLLTGSYCEHWPLRLVWFPGRPSLLHSTSWRGTATLFHCWPPPQRRQVPPLCPARAALRLSPHCHLRSLSPVRGSLSLAALLALPPSVKRCSRAGFLSSRSLGRLSSGGLYPPSPSFPMSFSPVLPPTSAKPVRMLTVPSERLWSPSWGASD